MPQLTVYDMHSEIVWQGDADVQLNPPCPPDRGWTDVTIRQEGEDRNVRFIHVGELFDPALVSWDLSAPVARIVEPDPQDWDDALTPMLRAEIVGRWNLHIDLPAGALERLRVLLDEPVQSPDTRRRLGELRARAYRSLDLDHIAQALHAGAIDQDQADRLRTMHTMQSGAYTAGQFQRFRERMTEAQSQVVRVGQHMHEMLEAFRSTMPASEVRASFGFDPSGPYEGTVCMDALRQIRERVTEHDEVIASTRAEFPHDPLGYGRIYPGNEGTSRWTPPDDPDEVIRSCPA